MTAGKGCSAALPGFNPPVQQPSSLLSAGTVSKPQQQTGHARLCAAQLTALRLSKYSAKKLSTSQV